MKMVTTKAVAKAAAVATGIAMAASMLSFAPMAQAASLTASQIQSILGLLSSFGANSSTIANVNAALTGQPSTTTTTTTSSSSSACNFTMSLTMKSRGADVTCLQQALIAGGFSIPAGATGYFGAETRAAVIAWQKSVGVKPAYGYFGPISRAHWNLGGGSSSTTTTTGTGTGTGTVTTGTGLNVTLSPTSPNGSVLVAGQGIGDLGDFVFSNPSSAPINVTGLTFNRTGVSNDATLANVYLYNAGTRITDSAGVNNGQFSYSNSAGLFTVPANSTYTVSVRSDIATGSSGQQIGVSLVSVSSNGTLASSVSFPIMGGYQTISAANLAVVSYGATVSPSVTTISPQTGYPVWQDTVSVATNPVKLSSMMFTNLGSIDGQYLTNLRLYVDGVQVGSTIPSMSNGRTVTFDLTANPVMLSEQSHVIKVLADITGGAGRTIQLSVQRSSDAMFVDSQLNQPVTPEYNNTTFSAVTQGNSVSGSTVSNSGAITINSVGGSSGVSVSLDPSSPTSNVAVGASNADWANFDMLASGENVKVSDLYVYVTSSNYVANSTGATAGGLANGKIEVNGVQVGSTKTIGEGSGNATDFSLGSSLILPAGQTTVVGVYADARNSGNTALTNNVTEQVTLAAGSLNGQGQSSLNSVSVPSSAVPGQVLTVSNSSLSATQYSGYGIQTFVAGTNNAKIGAFTLSAGSTEGVTVNTISLGLTGSSNVTNLTLKNDATGAILGTIVTTPSSSNSFAVNLDIPVSSSVTIDVYGNILTGATGTIQASVGTGTTGSGDMTGTQAQIGTAVSLQTMTVGSGVLTVTRGAGDPVSNNVLAGASQVQVGQFNFAAQNSGYTVQNLAVLVPNGAATSVTNVTLSYTDVNGATQTVTQPLAVNSSLAYATATFTGLTMYVPTNSSANLNVFVGTPTIASGAFSGAAINVKLYTGASTSNTFQAINGAGSPTKTVSGGDSNNHLASNGIFYVRKSIPTFAAVAMNSTVPSSGSPLYKFSISADPAGAVEWTHLTFNIATTGTSITNMYLTNDSTGNSLTNSGVYGKVTSTKATFDLPTLNGSSGQPQYQQIAAGATQTYDLYGTVNGWPTGATLTISLASDGTNVTNNQAATVATNGANVVWSDRSASPHSITSSDWTNGYLLKNFTSSAVSYSH